jgi:hypothetical protein
MFNQGLNVTVLSYLDQLDIGVVACAKRVPQAKRLAELMRMEAHALLGDA